MTKKTKRGTNSCKNLFLFMLNFAKTIKPNRTTMKLYDTKVQPFKMTFQIYFKKNVNLFIN